MPPKVWALGCRVLEKGASHCFTPLVMPSHLVLELQIRVLEMGTLTRYAELNI